MLSIRGDIEEEIVLRREREDAEARGYPAWAPDFFRKLRADNAGTWLGGRSWTIAERKAYYACLLDATRPAWNYGRIYLNANEMRTGETHAPSLTTWQTHVEEDAMRGLTQ